MTEPRFDSAQIEMLRRVGRDTLATRMIDLFLGSAPGRAAAIEAGHADGDVEAVRRAAHSLKPSAGQLGAMQLQAVCRDIEDAAIRADLGTIAKLLPDLRVELAAATDWLRAGAPAQIPPE